MNKTVLILEDDADLAEDLAELLEELTPPVRTICCHDEAAALAAARAHHPLVALVDLRIGNGTSGLDALQTLRTTLPHLEAILMTGFASMDTAMAAVRRGVFAYVPKPFDPEALVQLCQRALDKALLRVDNEKLASRLSRSEALHRNVVAHSPALLLGIDAGGLVTFANPFAQRTLELTEKELVGFEFSVHCVGEPLREKAQRWVSSGGHGQIGPSASPDQAWPTPVNKPVHKRPSGRANSEAKPRTSSPATGNNGPEDTEAAPRQVRWTFSPVSPTLPDGTCVLALGMDVTEELAAEKRTRQAESMAAMGRLTTALAHEIRNPLNAANLQLELLLRTSRYVAKDEVREQIDESGKLVRQELKALSAMLDEFLSMARAPVVRLGQVDLAALVHEVVKLSAPLAATLGVSLNVDIKQPLSLRADGPRLRQVLHNLLRNALEALDHQADGQQHAKEVNIVGQRDGELVRLEVYDNGPGFDAPMLEQGLQPFSTTKEAGTGLGLAIVDRVIAAHGGSIQLGNHPAHGGGQVTLLLPQVD